MITQSKLKEFLNYCPDTGVFTWRVSNSNRSPVGSIAGCFFNRGYVSIAVNRKRYQAHRLAWLYVHGTVPRDGLDHINRVKNDNRICNLRIATQAENMQNLSMRSDNSSGYAGVSWNKHKKKWRTYIVFNNKQIHIGYFPDLSDAISARSEAKEKYHKFHPECVA